jgi:predicted lipoprotein with Yx(FWY)xxD motif
MGNSLLARVPMPARLGALLATALLAAACGSSGTTSSSTPAAGGTSTAGASSTSSSTANASATALVVTTKSGSAGAFLTDGSGRAMYLWEKDPMNKSVCTGACASAWPPVPASGTVTASGSAVSKDLGTITRSDGTKQLTYDGHPLYYFSGDTGPGQTNGQGSDGFGAKWWLVSPSGTMITGSESGSSPSTSPSSSSGYGGGY